MNGSRVGQLVFGVCLCAITATTFQLQHRLNLNLKPHQVYSSSSGPDFISKEIHRLTRDDIDSALLHTHTDKVDSEMLKYSLASALVSILSVNSLAQQEMQTQYVSFFSVQNVTHLPIQHMNIKNIGHRGSPYTALENTGRSFVHAAQAGADGVELDVFLLKCGTLVVFHGSGDDNNPGLLNSYCEVEGSM